MCSAQESCGTVSYTHLDVYKRQGQGVETLQRTYCDIVPGQPVHVGAIEVLPILCKAKSYYDFAFFIRTPDGTCLLYTSTSLLWQRRGNVPYIRTAQVQS